jgi:hypothetical protein
MSYMQGANDPISAFGRLTLLCSKIGPDVRHLQITTLVLALLIFADLPNALAKDIQRGRAPIIGCWKRTGDYSPRWGSSSQTLCFPRKGDLWGATYDAGDGWDYGGPWRVFAPDKVAVWFPYYDAPQRTICSFWIDGTRQFLVLSDCEGSKWNDVWHRDLQTEQAVQP